MAWIESHADLRDHPKTDLLMELLGVTRRDAVGLVHFVWWRALTYAPSGDLSGFTDGQIARWADWDGAPGDLIAGLTGAGFMDEQRTLHDWQEYAGRWIDRREANATRKREARARKDGTSTGHPPDVASMSGATGPNRTLTGPDLTGPDPHPKPLPRGGRGSAAGAAKKTRRGGEIALRADAEDRRLWARTLDRLKPDVSAGNFEQVGMLVPIGRAPDGGLHLRAPPGTGPLAQRFRPLIVRALLDVGDQAATQVAIVEG